MTQTHTTPVVRFAPSPTGFLHIGGARTALFNSLFARHHGGQFLLRIEDTDQERSTQQAVDAILNSLQWLGLPWDGATVFQSKNIERHQQVGHELYTKGRAYYCQCSPEALQAMREQAMQTKQKPGYNGHCRDKGHTSGALRLLTPDTGAITINDLIQGPVEVRNDQIDDMVLLRSDGTPTYLLSVVVDDRDMGITHVIRGDDHLTNTFRQYQIYEAMGWEIPQFAHIPLIYGPDGTKLSKRHGAISVEVYRDMGYLPQALRNYLLRLGWSHGDDEIISDAQAAQWFSLAHVGKSPSRFDFKKLDHVNAHYLRLMDNAALVEGIVPFTGPLSDDQKHRITLGMDGLKVRATTLKELGENARVYIQERPLVYTEDAQKILNEVGKKIVRDLIPILEILANWSAPSIEAAVRTYAETQEIKLGQVAQPLRAAITGHSISPSVFDVMEIWGKEECMSRLRR